MDSMHYKIFTLAIALLCSIGICSASQVGLGLGLGFQCPNLPSCRYNTITTSKKTFLLQSNKNSYDESAAKRNFFSNFGLQKHESKTSNQQKIRQGQDPPPVSRRQALNGMALAMTTLIGSADKSEAACLSGDTDKQCIGVYKLPVIDKDNADAMRFIDTPEHLRAYAPDILHWVPPVEAPNTMVEAVNELREDLHERVKTVNEKVIKGDLISAGTEILYIVPRVTVTGNVVISELNKEALTAVSTTSKSDDSNIATTPVSTNSNFVSNSNLSMRAYRSEVAYRDLLANLGNVDIMIGQALDGQLGRITVAQIQILEVLEEANQDFDDFIKAISCIDCSQVKRS